MKYQSHLVWGFQDPDREELQPWTEMEEPRRTKDGGYTTAFQAMGYEPVRVRIIKESDFKRLLKLAGQTISNAAKDGREA